MVMKETFRDEFHDHRDDMRKRLVRIEDKLDGHKHGAYVPWPALVSVLIAVVSAIWVLT